MSDRRDPFQQPENDFSNPSPPDIYGRLRVAEKRRRNRRWEKEHNSRKAVYRSVDPKLALRVKKLASEFAVPEGEVARFLLAYALRAYHEGNLDLIPYPNPYRLRMTLFPLEETPQRADLPYQPRKVRRAKSIGPSWKVITTWRGFPPELKNEISELASAAGLDVPQGELVTALLRYSFSLYDLGVVTLDPVVKVGGYQLEGRGK